MNAEYVFSIANITALAGWLVLIVMGRHRWAHTLVTGAILPGGKSGETEHKKLSGRGRNQFLAAD